MKKLYLSGAIKYDLDYVSKFYAANTKYKKLGYQVINPIALNHDHDKTWKSYMKECIKELVKCDYIVNIDTQEIESKGRDIELLIAESLGIKHIDTIVST